METSMWNCILSPEKKTEDALGKELFINDVWLHDCFFGESSLLSLAPQWLYLSWLFFAVFSAELQLLLPFPPFTSITWPAGCSLTTGRCCFCPSILSFMVCFLFCFSFWGKNRYFQYFSENTSVAEVSATQRLYPLIFKIKMGFSFPFALLRTGP